MPRSSSTRATALDAELLARAIGERIASLLPGGDGGPELDRYYRLLREYPARAGKQIRARLVCLSTLAHGAPWQAALTAASALELFQNWVLVHDDVEDDSTERRGLPTLHMQVGKAVAINVGDGLHAYMWQLLLDDRRLPREVLNEFLWMVHRTSEGQHLDLASAAAGRFDMTESEYLEMVRLKTACYTVVSPLRLGALCAGRTPDERLRPAGEDLGIAFQIRDDVLSLTPGAPSGKEFAADLFEGKRTLILAHFFAHATAPRRRQAVERLASARRERSTDDVQALLAMLAEQGSLDYAQQVAEQRAGRGLALLREALPGRGRGPAEPELLRLLESLVTRSQ